MRASSPLVDRRSVLERVRRAGTPLVLLHAPAGYGKSYLAKRIVSEEASAVVACGSAIDWRAVHREFKRLSANDLPSSVVIEDIEQFSEDDARQLRAFCEASDVRNRIVLTGRGPAMLAAAAAVAAHDVTLLARDDLAFSADELTQLFDGATVDAEIVLAIAQWTRGWPAAALFMARFRSDLTSFFNDEEPAAELLPFLHYAYREVVMPLPEAARALAGYLCAVESVSSHDAHRLPAADAMAVAERDFQVVERRDARLGLHPLVAVAVRTIDPDLVDRTLREAAQRAASNADGALAAQAYAMAREYALAEEALARAPNRQTLSFPARFRRAIPWGAHPRLWTAAFAERRYATHPLVLEEEAASLRSAGGNDQNRALAYGALSGIDAGHFAEIIPTDAYDGLVAATAASRRGDLRTVRDILARYRSAYDEDVACAIQAANLDVERARSAAQWELEYERIEVLRSVQHLPPASRVLAEAQAAFGAWLAGDPSFESAARRFDRAIRTVRAPAFAPLSAALTERPARSGGDPLWFARALLVLSALSRDPDASTQAARDAVPAADASHDVLTQVLARVVLSQKQAGSPKVLLAEALRLADEAELRPYSQSVRALIDGEVRGAVVPLLGRIRAAAPPAPPVDPAPLEIRLATGQVRRGETELHLSIGGMALLVALAVERRAVSNETLCDRLWPDTPFDQAYKALKMCVHRTRGQLGDSAAIVTTERGYGLGEHVAVDTRFLPRILEGIARKQVPNHLESRLDVIFAQVAGTRPTAFMDWDWFEPTEALLQRAAQEVGGYLARRRLDGGDPSTALVTARRLVELDPLDERAREYVVRAHLALNDRSAALAEYRHFRDVLQKELGVEPSATIRAHLSLSPET